MQAQAVQYIEKLAPVAGEHNREPAEWSAPAATPLESDAYAGASVTACIEALRSGTITQKRQAASALALRELEQAVRALGDLIALVDEPAVRIVAMRALARLGPHAVPAIARLRQEIESDDSFIRVGTAYALSRIGPEAAPALQQCTTDPNPHIAGFAREALQKLE